MSNSSNQWIAGNMLPGNYRILRMLGQGGMGRVFLVQRETHRAEILKFAVKVIKDNVFSTDRRRDAFFREIRNWIDLPRHPNLTRCKFFKTLSNETAVFAEYVQGGSLRQWVKTRKLDDLRKIWDLAIQSAWGLEAAHSCGTIHLDMKPANLLLNHQGILKITDFGLSVGLPDRQQNESQTGVRSSSHGMTPAFASIEQLKDMPVDQRTDQWSWAATILYIFTESVTWSLGLQAPEVLCTYLKDTSRRVIPDQLVRVLERCFMEDPDHRWTTMKEVSCQLINGYEDYFKENYPRSVPGYKQAVIRSQPAHQIQKPLRDQLIDGYLLQAASALGKDEQKLFQSLPRRDGTEQTQTLVNIEYINRLEREIADLKIQSPVLAEKLFLLGNLERANIYTELNDTAGAISVLDQSETVLNNLHGIIEDIDWLDSAQKLHMLRGGNLSKSQDFSAARTSFELAEDYIRQRLKIKQDDSGWACLFRARMNKAAVIGQMGLLLESIELAEESIAELQSLDGQFSDQFRLKYLAGTYTNKAASLGYMDRDVEAAEAFLKAANVVDRLILEFNQHELYSRLVHVLENAANAMMFSDQYERAEQLAIRILHIVREHFKETSRPAIHARLQASDIVIHILKTAGKLDEADAKSDLLIATLEKLIYQRGMEELAPMLLKALRGKMAIAEDKKVQTDLTSARNAVSQVKTYFKLTQ